MNGHYQRIWKDSGDIEIIRETVVRHALSGNYRDMDEVFDYLESRQGVSVDTHGAIYSFVAD